MDKVAEWMKAREAGNRAQQAALQAGMKGADLTRLARAVKAADDATVAARIAALPTEPPTNSPDAEPAKETTTMATTKTTAAKTPKAPKAAPVAPKAKPTITLAPKPAPKPPRPAPLVGNVIQPKYRERYSTIDGLLTPGGSKVIGINDPITALLAGQDTAALELTAQRFEIEFKWAHLNPGMQRMNLGNRLRGLLRQGKIELSAPAAPKAAKTKKAATK